VVCIRGSLRARAIRQGTRQAGKHSLGMRQLHSVEESPARLRLNQSLHRLRRPPLQSSRVDRIGKSPLLPRLSVRGSSDQSDPHRAPSNSRFDGLLCLMRADAARCTILAEADDRQCPSFRCSSPLYMIHAAVCVLAVRRGGWHHLWAAKKRTRRERAFMYRAGEVAQPVRLMESMPLGGGLGQRRVALCASHPFALMAGEGDVLQPNFQTIRCYPPTEFSRRPSCL